MRNGIENYLLKHWYSAHDPPWFLRMLEPVYRAAYRNAQNKQKAVFDDTRSSVPVVVVGNITAGGSGKTPLVIALCQMARDLHLKVGIASTGYGRQSRATILVQPDSDSKTCGDEPLLLAQRCGVPVVVAVYRTEAVRTLEEMGIELVISDDGLQQADLKRELEICVIDGSRGLGNGHLLPAGPLRESADRLALVERVISNGSWAEKPGDLDVSLMTLEAMLIHSLDDTTVLTLSEFQQRHEDAAVHAVAAIGNPERFFKLLTRHGIDHIPHRFADHHGYAKQDFSAMANAAAIVMTEKDAVKCRRLGLENAWYLPVDALLTEEFQDWFKNKLLELTLH